MRVVKMRKIIKIFKEGLKKKRERRMRREGVIISYGEEEIRFKRRRRDK